MTQDDPVCEPPFIGYVTSILPVFAFSFCLYFHSLLCLAFCFLVLSCLALIYDYRVQLTSRKWRFDWMTTLPGCNCVQREKVICFGSFHRLSFCAWWLRCPITRRTFGHHPRKMTLSHTAWFPALPKQTNFNSDPSGYRSPSMLRLLHFRAYLPLRCPTIPTMTI